MTSVGSKRGQKIDVKVDSPSLGYAVLDVTSNAFSTIIATLILLYFLLVYGDSFLERCGKLVKIPSNGRGDILKEIENSISRYLVIFTFINLCLAIAIGSVLWLLSVPNAPLWGAMAGLLNFIPYIGSVIGASIVFLVALLSFDTTWQVVLPPAAYFAINSIEGQVITPILLGNRLRLSPLVILVSMMVWGWAWGIEGALLSVPLLAIFKIVCDHIPSLNNLGKVFES